MTVEFDGEERTFSQMSGYLEANDRSLREAAWTAMTSRRMEDHERMSEIFDELVSIRHEMAQNAGFDSYTEFMFKAMHRFDYTLDDCLEFHAIVGRRRIPTGDLFLRTGGRMFQQESPTTWTGIATTSTVGEQLDQRHRFTRPQPVAGTHHLNPIRYRSR